MTRDMDLPVAAAASIGGSAAVLVPKAAEIGLTTGMLPHIVVALFGPVLILVVNRVLSYHAASLRTKARALYAAHRDGGADRRDEADRLLAKADALEGKAHEPIDRQDAARSAIDDRSGPSRQ
jgi:hypothetical protein